MMLRPEDIDPHGERGDFDRAMAHIIRVLLWVMAILAGYIILLVAVTIWAGPAKAHSFYEIECCSEKDCASVEDGRITEGPDGYKLPDGSILPYGDKRIKFSPDHQYHWCHGAPVMGSVATFCLYVPGRGI